MKKLLSLPPNLVDCFHEVAGVATSEYFCTSDPVGSKLGSGGGTHWLLKAAYLHDKNTTETEYEINNISLSCTYSEINAAGGSQYPSTSYSYDLTTTSKTKYAVRYKYTYSTGSIGDSNWTTDGVNW